MERKGRFKGICILTCLFLAFFLLNNIAIASVTKTELNPISGIVKKEIRKGRIPGAVILIGTRDKILYHQAFGWRSLKPEKIPMSTDTVFDLASLTKAVATTTAIMKLAEDDRLKLDDRVSVYWPEFSKNGKEEITIRELMTHYSGLRADISLNTKWHGYNTAMNIIADETPVSLPGSKFTYSDINFEILGEIARRVSGKPLDVFCNENIFDPLGMEITSFNPPASDKKNIAPTQKVGGKSGRILCGEVHDPTASRMGGIAGHAGLFSTSGDLSKFAKMLLSGGSLEGKRILEKSTINTMTTPQSPSGKLPLRGLGWAMDAPFASNRDSLPPMGSYGHKGYTGTFLWIDPVSDIYVIILTNRVHPNGKGDAEPLRNKIIELVSSAVGQVTAEKVLSKRPSLSNAYAYFHEKRENSGHNFKTGIDVLKAEGFKSLSGLRVGLITNHTGIDSNGKRTIDLIANTPEVELKAIFSPEHGLSGKADSKIGSATETVTGLPVYSLYGDTLRPTDRMFEGIDAVVFDMQDAGARFYTYITTMAYAMEEAAKKELPFYVLDRPNPINATSINGPLMDRDFKSFTGYFPLPVRHGMTVGELAVMFNRENDIGAKLHVIKMEGYKRSYWFDETGLKWVPPSPNLRNLREAALYPGVALLEGANISVGRGTTTPFEIIGAPWIKEKRLASYLSQRKIKGVKFKPAVFRPESDIFRNKTCRGVKILLEDRNALDPALLGVELISAIHKLHPGTFQIGKTLEIIGSREVFQELINKKDPALIAMNWKDDIEKFKKLRAKYLLY